MPPLEFRNRFDNIKDIDTPLKNIKLNLDYNKNENEKYNPFDEDIKFS